MENIQITLNKGKSVHSSNVENYVSVDLNGQNKPLINTDIQSTIDEYKQYIKEKDASNKYRLIFTINPVCCNVLYNHITELVYKEGDNYCELISKDTTNLNIKSKYCGEYIKYGKNLDTTHEITTRDTGLSCDDNFTYHPGIDIFNNHHLRRTDFVVINPKSSGDNKNFNTIFDTLRDDKGNIETGLISPTSSEETELHLYDKNTIMSASNLVEFGKILDYSLLEKDGWFGFTNKALLPLVEHSGVPINRVICNRRECDFIDLYPDRTLFSFVPKWNDYRKRPEYNWNYCLTYPYKNDYTHPLIVSGITGSFDIGEDNEIIYTSETELFNVEVSDVRIRTDIRHNFKKGDMGNIILQLTCSKDTKTYNIPNVNITSIGKYGYDSQHYLSIDFDEIQFAMKDFYSKYNTEEITAKFYFKKISNGRECKYYMRIFKKIPNFKNTKYSNLNKLDDTIIDDVIKNNDFNSSINKLGFSKNAYGDDLSQIIFNDDIDTTGLRDNLGRELTTLYLTIVKNNKGYYKWYYGSKYNEEDIEYSHCFGKVTSGFDLPDYVDNYNVHKLHNISEDGFKYYDETNKTYKKWDKYPITCEYVESGLSVSENIEFFGDIVELDEEILNETILENIQYRFNTAQREYSESGLTFFSQIRVDTIEKDDYDGEFKGMDLLLFRKDDNKEYKANIAPEGYYHQAHYPIGIREFDDEINEGYHTYVNVIDSGGTPSYSSTNGFSGVTLDRNYYFNVGDEVYLYDIEDPKNVKKYTGTISFVNSDYTIINIVKVFDESGSQMVNGTTLENLKLYKPNLLKPLTAYEINDGSGRFIWRNIKSYEYMDLDSELNDSTFTNGCHYLHKQINFYLKRQDPFGNYGLQPSFDNFGDVTGMYGNLEITGENKDVTMGEYIEPGVNDCLRFNF